MSNSKNKSKGFYLAGNNGKYGFKTVPNDSVPWRLQSADGTYFGDVSYDAYKAVENNSLDSYKPKSEEEKHILESYKKWITQKANPIFSEKSSKKFNISNPVFDSVADKFPYNHTSIRKFENNQTYPNMIKEDMPETEKKTVFQAGAFDDGYQLFDGIKTVGATVADAGVGVGKGVLRLAEGLVDLGAYGVSLASGGASKLSKGLFGDNKFADKAEKFSENVKKGAQADSTAYVTQDIDKFLDKNSLLGDYADAAAEGLGYVGGMILTAGVGGAAGLGAKGKTILTSATTAASSMGGGMGEAYQSRATDGQAVAFGAMKGAIDAGTELISGGLGKVVKATGISRGIGGLDDIFAKKLSSKLTSAITNETVQKALGNTIEYTVKGFGEGTEEVLAGLVSAVAKKFTYMSDETLAKLVEDENLLEQFVMGSVISFISQSPDYVKSLTSKTDFVTNFTKEEEALILDEFNKRISEAESDGQTLSKKDKNKLYGKVYGQAQGVKQALEIIKAFQPKQKTDKSATESKTTVETTTEKAVDTSSIKIGDVFKINNDTESVIKVIDRNDTVTSVEVTYKNGESETMDIKNDFADSMINNPKYTRMATETAQDNIDASVTETVDTTNTTPVNVGDVFTDTKNGDTIKIIARDETTTTVEFTDKDGNVGTTEFNNNSVNMMNTSPRYTKTESASAEAAPATEKAQLAAKDGVETHNEATQDTKAETEAAPVTNAEFVKAGDTFVNTKGGTTFRVVARDNENTTIEKTTKGGKVTTAVFANQYADALISNPQYQQVVKDAVLNTEATAESLVPSDTKALPRSADGTLSKSEINSINKWDNCYFYDNGDNILISDSHIMLFLTREQFDYVKSNIKTSPMQMDRLFKAYDTYIKLDDWGKVTDTKIAPKDVIKGGIICIVDNKGYLFSKTFCSQLKKRSHTISIVGNDGWDFALMGYDESGNPTGFVLPVKTEKQTIDGVEIYTGKKKPKSKAVTEASADDTPTKDISENTKSTLENSTEVLNNQNKGGIVEKTQEAETNVNAERYDSIGTTQLRENNQNGVHSQGSNTTVTEDKSDSERRQGGIDRSNKEEYDNRNFQKGIVRNVFHGTPYNFTNHEKSYVDLGIHFGNEEQAKTRLSSGQGNILQRDLQLENPLVTQDIFGERTPEQYVTEEEANAVLEYKTAEAYKINAKLREDENLLTDYQKDLVKLLDRALEKLPKHKGTAYRTVSFDDLFNSEEEYKSFIDQHTVGSFVAYKAYTSASSKVDGHPMPDNTKYGITLEIEGENGRDIDGFGNNFEKEVVFPRGFSFVVTDVTTDNKGGPYIKMKEVGENDRQERHTEERSDILQQMSTEEELHSDVHEISERNTVRSGDTKDSVQRVQANTEQNTGEIEKNNVANNSQNMPKSSERTSRPSDSGTADSRTENITNETEVGAGEVNDNIYKTLEKFGLTDDEQYAILEYKSSGSYTLNNALREGETLSDEQKRSVKDINSALDKFPTYKGTVYRNIGFSAKEEFDNFISTHTGKSTVTYPAFTSASKSENGYIIDDLPYTAQYAIESTYGRDVADIGLVEEQEVLFKADSEFEITNIEISKNNVTLKCKEIENNERFENELRTSDKERRNEQKIEANVGEETDFRENNENFGQMGTVRGRSTKPYETSGRNSEHIGNEVDGNVLEDSGELRTEVGNESYAQGESHNGVGEVGNNVEKAETPHGKGGFVFKENPSHLFKETQEVTNNVRGKEIPDTINAESRGGVEQKDSGGKGSNRERIRGKIKEILRKSSAKRDNNRFTENRSSRLDHKETAEAFEERVLNEGYTYVKTSKISSIAYKYAPKSEWNKNANEATELLESLGITVVVFEGDLHSNRKGVSQISSEGATVGTGNNLTVFISSDLGVDGMETAYHEALHALRRMNRGAKHHHKMVDIISDGVNVESEAFEKFVSALAKLYSYEDGNVSTKDFSEEITEEFYAWYVGSIYANKNEHSVDMLAYIKRFSDVDSIKPQLDAIFTEVKSDVATETPANNSQNTPKSSENKSDEQTPTEAENVKIEQNTGETEERATSTATTKKPKEIQYSISDNGYQYTYNALTSKPDMVVTLLESGNVRDENGNLNRANIINKGIKNVRQKNNAKNTEDKSYVYVSDINRDVLVGKRGLSHGLSRNADATALVTTKIGDVLENAIKINELIPRKNELGSYVLLSIAMDKNKNYYPVRVVVSQYSAVEEVEVLDVLYAANAKKKNQSSNEAELPASAVPPIKGSSTISISNLLELVKTEFSDILTGDVLNNLGVNRKKSTLSGSIKYSTESEGLKNEQTGNCLLSGNSRRTGNESTRKQTSRISDFEQEIKGKSEAERKSFAKELLAEGQTEEVKEIITDSNGKSILRYNLVKPEAYNDDMLSIVNEAKAKGIEVGFFVGSAQRAYTDFKIDAMVSGTKVLLRYDGYYSPQMLMKHEDTHIQIDSENPEMLEARDTILNDLSEAEKAKILETERYKKYMELYKGDKNQLDKVWDEFVADVFAGMSDYTDNYIEMVADYWYNTESVDNFKVSEYTHSTDAGGADSNVLYSVSDPKWHTGFLQYVVNELEQRVERDARTSTRSITETANWYTTKINGVEYFSIYSTEVKDNPTVLYVSRGRRALIERNILLDLLEDIENGKNFDGQSENLDEILRGGWLHDSSGAKNNNGTVGRESDSGNVGTLQSQSSNKSSRAFRDVIENLFEISDRRRYSGTVTVNANTDADGTGGMSNEQISTSDSRGTDRILGEDRYTPRRDTSHTENVHNGESAWNDERIDRIENEGRRVSEGSYSQNLDNSTLRSVSTENSRRAEANGRRYLEALSNNNEIVARKLLNEQAEQNGYETTYLYHGTHKGKPFDAFKSGGIIWVTESQTYAQSFAGDIAEDITSLDYLFTETNSGVFELYAKKGKILDVGNTDAQIENLADFKTFADKVGFSMNEILECWNARGEYESSEIWTITRTAEFANIAREHGYDSLRAIENGDVETFGILYPHNLKSSKLITYDDNGNIIPLEKRFDNSKDSLRYSIATEESVDTDTLSKDWDEALEKYGAIQKGEKPTRDIDIPRKRSKNEPVSQFARTALEAGITPNEVIDDFQREVMFGKMAHEVITDKTSEEKAISKIKHIGFEEAVKEWDILFKDGKVGKEDFVFGMVLYNQAITNKDYNLAMKLVSDLAVEASHSAQVLQSVRMLKKMSPDGTLYYLEKSVEKMNEEFLEMLGDKFKGIKIDPELMKELYEAKTAEEREIALEKIEQNIADQIPSTLLDKWNAWRYLAMLGNVRTHTRNISGNLAFWGARRFKNLLGAIIEKTLSPDQRTKVFKKSKESVAFAKEDAEAMKDILTGTGGKYETANKIQQKRTIYKAKWLEIIRRKNYDFLEAEDWWFLRGAYQDSLAQLITARNIDIEYLKSSTSEANDLLNRIRAYAINEAKVATFRQASDLGNAINRAKRELSKSKNRGKKSAGILLEGVLPFTNVPINIAKQGVAYSPLGLIKGVYEVCHDVKKGEKSASEAIDTLSKGLTGTIIVALGVFLRAMGLLVAGPDDDEKKRNYNKMRGHQSYALQIGDRSYTIDWMAPVSLPLFVGVELYNLSEDEDTSGWDIINALSKIVDPMVELSVLQGVSDALDNAKYTDEEPFVAVPTGMLASYIGQALPTLGGQIARLIDDEQKKVYIGKGEGFFTGQIDRLVQTIAKKIPFASLLLEPKIDAWGEEKTYGSVAERIAESTISPGYYSKITTSEVDKELERLFKATGENSVYPTSDTVKSITVEGKEYKLNASQSAEYARERGQKAFELLNRILSDETPVKLQNSETGKYYTLYYREMSDDEKVKAIKQQYNKAKDEAKEAIFEKCFKK